MTTTEPTYLIHVVCRDSYHEGTISKAQAGSIQDVLKGSYSPDYIYIPLSLDGEHGVIIASRELETITFQPNLPEDE